MPSPTWGHPSGTAHYLDFALCRTFWLVLLMVSSASTKPPSTAPEIGIRERVYDAHALINATIVTQAGARLESGTLLIKDGIITAIGPDVVVPASARKWDLAGKTIYPGLIDAYSEVHADTDQGPAAYWNSSIRPERSISATLARKPNEDRQLREAGFVLRFVAPRGGVLAGAGTLVSTSDGPLAAAMLAHQVAQHVRLTAPGGGGYPRSPMGAVALARQALYDAQWYRDAWKTYRNSPLVARPEQNLALEALAAALDRNQLFIFDAMDEQYALRADRFAREFGLQAALRGSGREYQRLQAIVDTGRALIVPLDFPKPPHVGTVEAARNVSLERLMHWYLAPENPSRLLAAGATIALTTHGLSDKSQFVAMLRKAVKRGLDPDDALRACTTTPARLFGVEEKVGSLAIGKAAHLMITDGDWLDEKTKVLATWIDGKRFASKRTPTEDLSGTWQLDLTTADKSRAKLFLLLKQTGNDVTGKASLVSKESNRADSDQSTTAVKEDVREPEQPVVTTELKPLESSFGRVSGRFSAEIWQAKGTIRLTATWLSGSQRLVGELIDEQGTVVAFTGVRITNASETNEQAATPGPESSADSTEDGKGEQAEEEAKTDETLPGITLHYPLGALGRTTPPEAPTLAIEHATLWTCGPAGIIEDGTLLISDGKIVAVGKDVDIPQSANRFNARGKHVSPGIIDCHSHMATDGGVNEGSQAITSEVRIGDFVDASDISIYRQLAGGVTSSNILHGSANPIGGQNQVIKLRWGALPEEMKFREAPAGIKFALGENVKQSNWSNPTNRYPQTRMGVEQLIRDAFLAAQEYGNRWQQWRVDRQGLPPRRDLELDALLEILNHERWIHCHSYRQDEILALLRTLESFDIQIGTLQHVLEGYKVAQELASHGAMGSAFSDWWAYKFEVYDAIPYNGALMHEAGVVVSFNSDDAELARHLNHEAAKAVKYGGLPAEEALKFVTLNPAKQLRIDQHVGSLVAGKHADVVIWSGRPLSILSRCEQTWVDGRRYFSIEQDQALRQRDASLRSQLVKQVLASGEAMAKPGENKSTERELWPRHDEYCGRHGHGHQH